MCLILATTHWILLPGYAIILMFEQTKKEKYRIAAKKVREDL